MAIQKPTNPTEAMFEGMEKGLKIGRNIGAAIAARNFQIEYEAVADAAMLELDAIDTEMIAAQKEMENIGERIQRKDHVSGKEMFDALYGATMGQANRMKQKQLFLSNKILEYGNNPLITQRFGNMVSNLMKEQQTGMANMEGALQSWSTLTRTDIAAFGAQTDRAAQEDTAAYRKEQLDLEAKRLGITADELAHRKGIDYAKLGIDQQRANIQAYQAETGRKQINLMDKWETRKLNQAERKISNMERTQAVEEWQLLGALGQEAFARTGEKGLSDMAEQLSAHGVTVTADELGTWIDETAMYGKELQTELKNVKQRIAAAQEAVAAGDEGAIEVLEGEQLILAHLEESDRATRRARTRAIKAASLDGLASMVFEWTKEFAGSTELMRDMAHSMAPYGFVKNVLLPAREGEAQGAITPSSEAAKRALKR
ncbi:MAG: hypothetical protein ACYTFQ_00005, partial [Planctomycetota bacterium]